MVEVKCGRCGRLLPANTPVVVIVLSMEAAQVDPLIGFRAIPQGRSATPLGVVCDTCTKRVAEQLQAWMNDQAEQAEVET